MTKPDTRTDTDKQGHLSAVDLLETDRHGHTSIEVSGCPAVNVRYNQNERGFFKVDIAGCR